MRLDQLRGARKEQLSLYFEGEAPPLNRELSLRRLAGQIGFQLGERFIVLSGITPGASERLELAVDSGLPTLAWVVKSSPATHVEAGRLVVELRRFSRRVPLEQPLEIGVDEKCREDLRERFGRGGGMVLAVNYLDDQLLLEAAGDDASARRAVYSAGPEAGIEKENAAFRLYGARLAVDVRRDNDVYRITRIVEGGRTDEAAIGLLTGPILFKDISAVGQVSGDVPHLLDAAVRASGSYLKIWETYSHIEEEVILRRARTFGILKYKNVEVRGRGLAFELDQLPEDLDLRLALLSDVGDADLEVSEEVPDIRLDAPRPKKDTWTGRLVRREGTALVLAPPDEEDEGDVPPRPPVEGYLSLSLRGDRTRIRRRKSAEHRIRTGACPLTFLGLLLEDQPVPTPTYPRHTAMSPTVRKLFGGKPTPRQQEALNIALNTPDIAMIQGPPGTGKTKVIVALQARLAELATKGEAVSHRILISAAQHDAVEEVAQRTRIFDLPATKVGKRRGATLADGVEAWRQERVERLQDQLREPPVSERLQRVRDLAATCLFAPTPPRDLAGRLQQLRREIDDLLPPTLADRLLDRARILSGQQLPEADQRRDAQLRAVRGLRVEATSFGDDGPQRAESVLLRLKGELNLEQIQLLQAASDWLEEDPLPDLVALQAVQEQLLDQLRPPPPPSATAIDEDTQRLLIDLMDAIDSARRRSQGEQDAVLARYLEALEGDPEGLRAAITRYTVSLAATLQGAGSQEMMTVRGLVVGGATFETVIVDEAARAHPLDLLIPLSMAERRIVLVGDQRQLPHMLEPAVEQDLLGAMDRGELSEESAKALRDSLFARLWGSLRRLEALDGQKRTITLDKQYRMPKELGDFVSRNFYERHGDPHIDSGGEAPSFAHSLPHWQREGSPQVAVWVDVPGGGGRGEQAGRSKSRTSEARKVGEELSRILECNLEYTIGIITFYTAQVEEVWKVLVAKGLAEKLPAGGYLLRADLRERIRIGTVDAFQGKEFDIVLLSIVRSNELPVALADPGKPEERLRQDLQLRRKYGHLLLANRLCVAMSRQKKLLVVVGDRRFIEDSATEYLEPLRDFLRLCGG